MKCAAPAYSGRTMLLTDVCLPSSLGATGRRGPVGTATRGRCSCRRARRVVLRMAHARNQQGSTFQMGQQCFPATPEATHFSTPTHIRSIAHPQPRPLLQPHSRQHHAHARNTHARLGMAANPEHHPASEQHATCASECKTGAPAAKTSPCILVPAASAGAAARAVLLLPKVRAAAGGSTCPSTHAHRCATTRSHSVSGQHLDHHSGTVTQQQLHQQTDRP
jgi:hypothetical protein